MTTEQVPLAAQIGAVHDEVEKWSEFASAHPKMTPGERDLAARELEMWRAVLASLSDLAAANERVAVLERENAAFGSAYHNVVEAARHLRDRFVETEARGLRSRERQFAIDILRPSLAALDDAASVVATPAGKGETA